MKKFATTNSKTNNGTKVNQQTARQAAARGPKYQQANETQVQHMRVVKKGGKRTRAGWKPDKTAPKLKEKSNKKTKNKPRAMTQIKNTRV